MNETHAMTGKTNHFYLVSGEHSTVVVLTCLFIHYEITNREEERKKNRNILSPVNEAKKKVFFFINIIYFICFSHFLLGHNIYNNHNKY